MIQQVKGWEITVKLWNAFVKKEIKKVSYYRIHSMSPWNLVTQEPQELVGGSADPPVRLDHPYGPFLTPPERAVRSVTDTLWVVRTACQILWVWVMTLTHCYYCCYYQISGYHCCCCCYYRYCYCCLMMRKKMRMRCCNRYRAHDHDRDCDYVYLRALFLLY